jgi:hypothetical protein
MVLTLVITLKVMLLKVLTMTIMVVKIMMVIMMFIIWSTLPFLNSVLHSLVQVVLNQRMD